jgi:hypothetical protein
VIVIVGSVIRLAVPIVIVRFAFVGMVFSGMVGFSVAVMIVVVSGLAFSGVVVIVFLRGVVGLTVPVVVMAGLFRSPLFGRVILRGVVGDAVAIMVMGDARVGRGAVHHFADFQHRLGPIWLFF